ncbi:MAG: hypothetical protein MK098_12595 [Marinovum sp.]|nr:hypothetical protein [Marinovum sp.]
MAHPLTTSARAVADSTVLAFYHGTSDRFDIDLGDDRHGPGFVVLQANGDGF